MISGIEHAWIATIAFVPSLLLAIIIGVVGWFVARFAGGAAEKLVRRAQFDRLLERGGIKEAAAKSGFDASVVFGKALYWCVLLFTMQMAFGVFGPNPISDLLTRIIAFLPNVFVATVIVVIAAAIAKGVKEIIQASMSGQSYRTPLALAASGAILGVGIFAALNQLLIAPAIVNGLFYAILAVIAGSAIVAIGGGGIVPMRGVWEQAIDKVGGQMSHVGASTDGTERLRHRERDLESELHDAAWNEAVESRTAEELQDTHQPF